MSRPVKHTVPYFSHDADASGGRTLTILENHFGAEGYAAWFKLLEIISVTENHVIDVRNPADLEYLAGRMKFKPDRLQEIFNKMAERDAIDHELWAHKIIWCQNFVDRLSKLYEKRKQIPPIRPVIPVEIIPIPVTITPIPVDNCSSNATKYSIVKKSKVKMTTPVPPNSSSENQTDSSSSEPKEPQNIYQLYEQEIGELTAGISQLLKDAEEEYTAPWITDAIKIAVLNNHKSWSYIIAILRNCKKEGHSPSESRKGKSDDPDKYINGKYGHVVQR